jgi:hypothetical protein
MRVSTAKSTPRHGEQPALAVAMRNAVHVRTSLHQPDQCSKSQADEFDVRTQNTHSMRDSQSSTPELTIGDGGSVVKTGGRLTPTYGVNTAQTVATRSACTAHHWGE